MPDELKNQAIDLYRERYGTEPEVLGVAPGRVEVLGNHTDYNGGFVLAVALERSVAVAAGRNASGKFEITTSLFEGIVEVSKWDKPGKAPWTKYVVGPLKELAEAGAPVGGMKLAVASSVPVGAGLSSSAAMEVATAKAALALFPFEIGKMDLARLCQRAENSFVGVNCGLLDQFASVFGAENSALFLDCLKLEEKIIPLGRDDIAVVVANCMASHALADGTYNKIREECMTAAAELGKLVGRPVELLRDITLEEFETHAGSLPLNLRERADHIIHENHRVLDGVAALERGDIETFGKSIFASHASSHDLFHNSCPELDALVDLAHEAPGAIGAKLSGGGFGGCTVNLVWSDHTEAFVEHLKKGFEKRIGKTPEIHLCSIGAGAKSEIL
jgi:galactokinase